MDSKTLKTILEVGETVAVEFKRCGNGIESDTYDSVCSFLNRFGGDIFMKATGIMILLLSHRRTQWEQPGENHGEVEHLWSW